MSKVNSYLTRAGACLVVLCLQITGCSTIDARTERKVNIQKEFQNLTPAATKALAGKVIDECRSDKNTPKDDYCWRIGSFAAKRMLDIGDYEKGKEYMLQAIEWPRYLSLYNNNENLKTLSLSARRQAEKQEALSTYRLRIGRSNFLDASFDLIDDSDRQFLQAAGIANVAAQLESFKRNLIIPMRNFYANGERICYEEFSKIKLGAFNDGALQARLMLEQCQLANAESLAALLSESTTVIKTRKTFMTEIAKLLETTADYHQANVNQLSANVEKTKGDVSGVNFWTKVATLGMGAIANSSYSMNSNPIQVESIRTIKSFLDKEE